MLFTDKQLEAYRLRVRGGKSYKAVAETLDCSTKQAGEWVAAISAIKPTDEQYDELQTELFGERKRQPEIITRSSVVAKPQPVLATDFYEDLTTRVLSVLAYVQDKAPDDVRYGSNTCVLRERFNKALKKVIDANPNPAALRGVKGFSKLRTSFRKLKFEQRECLLTNNEYRVIVGAVASVVDHLCNVVTANAPAPVPKIRLQQIHKYPLGPPPEPTSVSFLMQRMLGPPPERTKCSPKLLGQMLKRGIKVLGTEATRQIVERVAGVSSLSAISKDSRPLVYNEVKSAVEAAAIVTADADLTAWL